MLKLINYTNSIISIIKLNKLFILIRQNTFYFY